MPSIVVDAQGVSSAGGQVLPDGTGIKLSGWTFQASNQPITKDADMAAFGGRIGGPRSLPEQLFGDSYLNLRHAASGLDLRFDALGALAQWHADARPPLRVAHAGAWQEARARDLAANGIAELQYDCVVAWQPSTAPMDRATLLAREPILFFADVPLYESELDDNGASQLGVKVRVMPSCWFVLLRFWLRVDGLLVRMRDVRLLHCFERSPLTLTRELLECEGSFEELRRKGAPAQPAAYRSADATAQVFQAISPVGTKSHTTDYFLLAI